MAALSAIIDTAKDVVKDTASKASNVASKVSDVATPAVKDVPQDTAKVLATGADATPAPQPTEQPAPQDQSTPTVTSTPTQETPSVDTKSSTNSSSSTPASSSTVSPVDSNGNAGDVPTPPDFKAIADRDTADLSKTADPITFDHSKDEVWYKSDAFSSALISFGTSLMSGSDIYTAMTRGGKTYHDEYGRDQRQKWADDLRKRGYDEQDIQAWIESGDAKDLPDLTAKKLQAVQLKNATFEARKNAYEASPEYQQWKAKREAAEDKLKQEQFAEEKRAHMASEALQAQSIQQTALARRDALEAKREAKGEEADYYGGRPQKVYTSQVRPIQAVVNKVNQRTQSLDSADNALTEALKEGDPEKRAQILRGYEDQFTRGILGGNATLTEESIKSLSGPRQALARIVYGIKTGTIGTVDDATIRQLQDSSKAIRRADIKSLSDLRDQTYKQDMAVPGRKSAQSTQFVNMAFEGSPLDPMDDPSAPKPKIATSDHSNLW